MPRGRKRIILGDRLGVLEPTGVQVTQWCPFTSPAGKCPGWDRPVHSTLSQAASARSLVFFITQQLEKPGLGSDCLQGCLLPVICPPAGCRPHPVSPPNPTQSCLVR